MINNKRVLVYFNEAALAPKGGPAAVCYYYYQEQKKRQECLFDFLPANEASITKSVKKNKLPKLFDQLHTLGATIKMHYVKPGKVSYNLDSYDLIHFHSTDSLYQARTSLEHYKGIVVLQSHSPEPRGREMFAALPKWVRVLFPFIKRGYEKMDRYAFNRADYLVFPCKEAEEPYYHTWPYFEKLHNIKPQAFKYVLTGIPEARSKRARSEVLAEQNIPDSAFVISYVGRHNEIKGYDVLKEIGKRYLEENANAWLLCAGNQAPLKGLEHPRWKEVGWTTEPHSYIGASDVFVLPNRETYFDIIMMELLSLGKIVVASNTGGNKWFAKHHCPGVFLYDTIDDALTHLNNICSMSKADKEELEKGNQGFYKENLSVSKMYDSYVQLLKELL